MPFSISEARNYVGSGVTGIPVIGGMVKSPINTAILIALIILLINMFVYRDVDTGDTGLFTLSLRSSIYILVLATGIIFLHNKHFLDELKKGNSSAELDSVFGAGETLNTSDEISTLSGTKLIDVNIADLGDK
jgi:hypothetical protein